MGFTRAAMFWGAIGAAGICILLGVGLILKERKTKRQRLLRRKRMDKGSVLDARAVGIALFAIAIAFTVFAVVCSSWPG
jgi:hypothetical protein